MKISIVSSGKERLLLEKSFKARKTELQRAIREKHAAEYSRAGLWQKLTLRWRMNREFRREWKQIAPSAHALYLAAT
jgi:hypothetical protein